MTLSSDSLPVFHYRTRRDHIAAAIERAIGDLMYYGRRECDHLPLGEIEDAIATGEVTVEEMAELFASLINGCLPKPT